MMYGGPERLDYFFEERVSSPPLPTRSSSVGNVAAPSQAPPELTPVRAKASIRASRRIAAALVLRDDDKP